MNLANIANIPLAFKVGAGAIAGLALLGGGIAAGAHLGSGSGVQTASTAPIVASPVPSQSPATATRNTATQTVRRSALAAEAQVLGITTKQLNADFKGGQTVQQLATAKGLSQAQFTAQFQPAVKTLLDQDVTAGNLTQAQEQQALKRLAAAVPNWSAVPRPAPRPSPTATP